MNWYALTTSPRKELALLHTLKEGELRDFLEVEDFYCPIETYRVRLRMKRHPIVRARPLTPGYVFVRTARPFLVLHGLKNEGVTGILYGADEGRPAQISDSALHSIKMREAEIMLGQARRYDRTKTSIRKGSKIKAGDRLEIPHLGINEPNNVEKIEGNYVEQVAPNGMRIRRQIADLETA